MTESVKNSEDYLCLPSKSWQDRYEDIANRSYPIVVEDVVEPFGIPTAPTGATCSINRNMDGLGSIAFDETGVKVPADEYSALGTRHDTYPGDTHVSHTSGRTATPPPVLSQNTYSPYRGPIQDEIHTQPYYGPIISDIITEINEPVISNYYKGVGLEKVCNLSGKVKDQVSEARIDELSNRYRERMSHKLKRHSAKTHSRSKSDNSTADTAEMSNAVGVNKPKKDDWLLKKYENALLQIEKLEASIKCLKMEVNSLTASKKQCEMRVCMLLFLLRYFGKL